MFSEASVSPSFHGDVGVGLNPGGVSASNGGCASRVGIGQTPRSAYRGLHGGGGGGVWTDLLRYMGYSQQVGSTHPTGMLSFFVTVT